MNDVNKTLPLYLDRNENLFGPSPACLDVLTHITAAELSTYPREYERNVKSKLSERLANDLGLSEQQILLSEGSEDMLKQVVHCYLAPGHTMLCPAQSWWYYRKVASEVGGVTTTFDLQEKGKGFAYDVESILRLHRERSPAIVLLASPNNPTGNSLSHDDRLTLLSEMRETIVVIDEAYWGFAEGPTVNPEMKHFGVDLAEFVRRFPNAIVLRSFSKLFALAGSRIAYAIVGSGAAKLTQFAARYLGYNRISEKLALAALDSFDYYGDVSRQIQREREKYYDFFDGYPGFTCFRSDANFVLVKVAHHVLDKLRSFLQKEQIFVKFFQEPEFKDCIRITIGTPEQNDRLRGALRRFLAGESVAMKGQQ